MLRPTYLNFIRYFYCTCLTRPTDVLSRFRNLAGAAQKIKIDKIESQVAPAEEAVTLETLTFVSVILNLLVITVPLLNSDVRMTDFPLCS